MHLALVTESIMLAVGSEADEDPARLHDGLTRDRLFFGRSKRRGGTERKSTHQ